MSSWSQRRPKNQKMKIRWDVREQIWPFRAQTTNGFPQDGSDLPASAAVLARQAAHLAIDPAGEPLVRCL
jgi:hypothetical protein